MADAPAAPVDLPTDGASPAAQESVVDEPGVKVFAGNLDYNLEEEELKKFFVSVTSESDVLSAELRKRGEKSLGYGFVVMATTEAAEKAAEALNGKELNERPAIVELAKPRGEKKPVKKRVGRRGGKAVPGEVTEAEANGEVEKAGSTGAEGEENKPKKKKKNPRKRKTAKEGAVPAENGAPGESGAEGAAPAGESEKKPKPKRTPAPRRPVGEEPTGELSKTTLFVANLPFELDDKDLGAIFTDEGFKVASARVVRRRWGHPRRSKGYGFVDVGSEEEQTKAIAALQGKELKGGRQIAVKVAVNAQHEEGSDEAPEAGAEKVNEEAVVA